MKMKNDTVLLCLAQRRFRVETWRFGMIFFPEFFPSEEEMDGIFLDRANRSHRLPLLEEGRNPETGEPFPETTLLLSYEEKVSSRREVIEGREEVRKFLDIHVVLLSPDFPEDAGMTGRGEMEWEVGRGAGERPLRIPHRPRRKEEMRKEAPHA